MESERDRIPSRPNFTLSCLFSEANEAADINDGEDEKKEKVAQLEGIRVAQPEAKSNRGGSPLSSIGARLNTGFYNGQAAW